MTKLLYLSAFSFGGFRLSAVSLLYTFQDLYEAFRKIVRDFVFELPLFPVYSSASIQTLASCSFSTIADSKGHIVHVPCEVYLDGKGTLAASDGHQSVLLANVVQDVRSESITRGYQGCYPSYLRSYDEQSRNEVIYGQDASPSQRDAHKEGIYLSHYAASRNHRKISFFLFGPPIDSRIEVMRDL